MYGVTDYFSAYVAYNLGFTYSMNLDFQLYDSSLNIVEEEDAVEYAYHFDINDDNFEPDDDIEVDHQIY